MDHETEEAQERRERLSRPTKARESYNHSYSRFVRWMRLVLPLAALVLVTIVFASNMQEETSIPVQEQTAKEKQAIGKNELVNPRFESTDEKKQPYTITATRAVQGETNEDLIILEKPVADMSLNNGSWIAIEADKGAYRQDTQRLLLQGNVQIFHDLGYKMETAQLHVDMNQHLAWSEVDVYGQGPAGTLEAKGLKANSETGKLIFTGPARLVLNRSLKGLN